MKPSVLLYDIDGTLITTGGAGRQAINAAFVSTFGRADACSHFSFSGMTDRAIVRLGLEHLRVEVDEAAIDRVIDAYLRHLEQAVRDASEETYRVHLGIPEALRASREAGCAVGLGTGNVERGARTKLERVGLFEHFDFGGYGDDHELRPELIRRGAERGAAKLGRSLAEVRVVIIGDTPKDVAAAKAIGADCLAVATGDHDSAELLAAGARWAFDDLTAPGALEALIRQASG